MTPAERLAGVNLKIGRAEEHVIALERAVRAFIDSTPYGVAARRESARKPLYYISSVEPIPQSLAAIAGDAVQNLKSSLDYLAFQLFMVGTAGMRGDGRRIYFPIDDDRPKFEANLSRRTDGIQQAAVDAMKSIEPYEHGKGHQLWILEQLNNTDKHRSLITVGSAFHSVDVGSFITRSLQRAMDKDESTWGKAKIPEISVPLVPADRMFPLKVGDVLFIGEEEGEFDGKMKFAFDVSFSEPGVADGQPLLETFHRLIRAVKDVIPVLEPFLS